MQRFDKDNIRVSRFGTSLLSRFVLVLGGHASRLREHVLLKRCFFAIQFMAMLRVAMAPNPMDRSARCLFRSAVYLTVEASSKIDLRHSTSHGL